MDNQEFTSESQYRNPDDRDLAILKMLSLNARMSNQEIADSLGISRVAVSKRISRMKKAGIITGYKVCISKDVIREYAEELALENTSASAFGSSNAAPQEEYSMEIDHEILEDMKKHCTYPLQDLIRSRGERFRYPVYPDAKGMNVDLSVMELSVRSFNCLRRAGFDTVSDLMNKVDRLDDLRKIRNLGRKSADEIMSKLFFYQYSILPEERKTHYLKRVLELNID